MLPTNVQHEINLKLIVPITASNTRKQHILEHYEQDLITLQDLQEWEDWYRSETHYAPANVKWYAILPSGCQIAGIGSSVLTIKPRGEVLWGESLDNWWNDKLGIKPKRPSLLDAMKKVRTVEDRDTLLKEYPLEERREYWHSQRRAAVDMAMAALEGNPSPLDDDGRGLDPDPTSLDLPEEPGVISVAAFKRLIPPGTDLELVRHFRGLGNIRPELLGTRRVLRHTPEGAVIRGGADSVLSWPRPGCARLVPEGVEIDGSGTGLFEKTLTYRINP